MSKFEGYYDENPIDKRMSEAEKQLETLIDLFTKTCGITVAHSKETIDPGKLTLPGGMVVESPPNLRDEPVSMMELKAPENIMIAYTRAAIAGSLLIKAVAGIEVANMAIPDAILELDPEQRFGEIIRMVWSSQGECRDDLGMAYMLSALLSKIGHDRDIEDALAESAEISDDAIYAMIEKGGDGDVS